MKINRIVKSICLIALFILVYYKKLYALLSHDVSVVFFMLIIILSILKAHFSTENRIISELKTIRENLKNKR